MTKQTITFNVSGTATQEIEILDPYYSPELIQKGLKANQLVEVQYRDSTGAHWGLESVKTGFIVANLKRAEFKLKLDNGFEKSFSEEVQILVDNKKAPKKKKVKKLGM